MTTVGDTPEMLSGPELGLDPRIAVIQDPNTLPEDQEAAFANIVGEFGPNLYGVVMKVVHNPADAEDVVQDSWLKAYKNIGDLEPGSLGGWLVRIATNTAIDTLRKKKRHPVGLIKQHSDYDFTDVKNVDGTTRIESGADEGATQNVQVEEALKLVNQLEPEFREPFMLWVNGTPYEEIADRLDMPIGTVRSRIHRAKHRLEEKQQAA